MRLRFRRETPAERRKRVLRVLLYILAALALFAAALGIRAFIGEDSHWFFKP